ncbi:MAG: MFS transporter [Chloroflexota bacterium]|nr:MFS transporter [Chloroflexota bacterium]
MSTTPSHIQETQKRIVRVLAAAQVLGGIGVASGAAVGALLAADLATDSLSGLAAASSVIGAALIAIPVSRLMNISGRRPGLLLAYAIGIVGAVLVVFGAVIDQFLVALVGLVAMGGGTTAGLQSRYAATDLATPDRRGRSLSTVVWATTIGSVLGPNLAEPMGNIAEAIGVPRLAGPYLMTIGVFCVSAAMIGLLLRPDPLIVAREELERTTGVKGGPALQTSIAAVLRRISGVTPAVLGLLAIVVGHASMVGVMSMTPVHLRHDGASLQIIGFVISGHITGMYIASPLVGLAADRIGRRPVIIAGGALLLSSFLIAGTATGHESTQLAIGLFLLGLGWSCTLIAGSTLLTESVPVDDRPSVQGTADLLMGIGGASAALLSGVVVGLASYRLLNLITTLLVVPLIVLAARDGLRQRHPVAETPVTPAPTAQRR